MAFYIILFGVASLFLICLFSIVTNQLLSVVTYEVKNEKLPHSFHNCKIVMLTDLHNHSFGKNNQRLYKKIDEINPDYILIAGDMVIKSNGSKNTCTFELLKNLSKKYIVYYAPGNHETRLMDSKSKNSIDFKLFLEMLQQMGIHYLENETEILTRNKEEICLSGLSIDERYFAKCYKKPKMEEDYIKCLLGDATESKYHILLAHSPNYFEQYSNWGADLIFSGHNHGGIVILPIIGGLIGTDFKLFPKYDFGKFIYNKSTMILSKGLAMHTIKVRIFNRPEITVVSLKRSIER